MALVVGGPRAVEALDLDGFPVRWFGEDVLVRSGVSCGTRGGATARIPARQPPGAWQGSAWRRRDRDRGISAHGRGVARDRLRRTCRHRTRSRLRLARRRRAGDPVLHPVPGDGPRRCGRRARAAPGPCPRDPDRDRWRVRWQARPFGPAAGRTCDPSDRSGLPHGLYPSGIHERDHQAAFLGPVDPGRCRRDRSG